MQKDPLDHEKKNVESIRVFIYQEGLWCFLVKFLIPRYIYIVWNLFWYSNKQTKTRGKYLYYRNMSPGKDFNNNLFFPVSPNLYHLLYYFS